MEIYAVVRPDKSKELLTACRAWIDARMDQAIIAGCLVIGLWFIANSLYLIVIS
jgi:hypothetical protein